MDKRVDWDEFSTRVPVNTRVKVRMGYEASYRYEAILLENKPMRFQDIWEESRACSAGLRVEWLEGVLAPWVDPRRMKFLLDGEWKSFYEIIDK